jgi:hypothetical protein
MAKLVGIKGLFLGLIPFVRSFFLKSQEVSNIIDSIVGTYGINLWNENDGLVTKLSTSVVRVAAFKGLVKDEDGYARFVNVPQTDFEFTGLASGSYKILFEYAKTYNEEGVIDLQAADATVVGTGTKFTEIFAPNMYVIISTSGEGNEGKYQIDSVTDDEHLELIEAFAGTTETGLVFAVGGHFPDPVFHPATDDEYRIYENDNYALTATTSAKTATQYYLGEVVWISGFEIVMVNDIRGLNPLVVQGSVNLEDLEIAASQVTSGLLALARGGTGVDLSTSGGAAYFLNQNAAHVIVARALTQADVPDLPATKTTSGTFDAARIPNLPASRITSGLLALARGGTNKDMSATGGTGQVLKQKTAGGAVSVETLAEADIPAAAVPNFGSVSADLHSTRDKQVAYQNTSTKPMIWTINGICTNNVKVVMIIDPATFSNTNSGHGMLYQVYASGVLVNHTVVVPAGWYYGLFCDGVSNFTATKWWEQTQA